MDNTLNNFDAEWEEFQYRWQKTHPVPVAPEKEPYPDLAQYYIQSGLLAIILLATTVVSGFHSFPVINSTFPQVKGAWLYLTGGAGFIMIEGATLLLSYWLAQILFRRVPTKYALQVVGGLLAVSLVLAVGTGWSLNIFSAKEGFGFDVSGWLPYIAGFTGSIATLMLFLGGFLFEINAIFYKDKCRTIDHNHKLALENFKQTELLPYQDKLRKEFEKRQNRKEQIIVPKEEKPRVSYNMSEAKRLIQEFLVEQPKAKTVEIGRALAERGVNVPTSTLHNLVKDIKQN